MKDIREQFNKKMNWPKDTNKVIARSNFDEDNSWVMRRFMMN